MGNSETLYFIILHHYTSYKSHWSGGAATNQQSLITFNGTCHCLSLRHLLYEVSLELMPTYEYRCEKCNETFELFQSMKDDALQVCPQQQCRMETWGQGKVKRLLGTGAGLIFKGSGFYITDYRSQSYTEAAKKESGSKEGGGAKTESSAPKTSQEKSSGGSTSKSES
jgi:putative FmdB family regulatory protein